MAPLPIPLTEPGKGQVTAESPKAVVPPSAVTPVKRAPAGDLPEKDRQRFVAPPFENGGKEERMADSRAPIREERPAMKPADTVMAAREKEVPPVGAEALGKAQDRAGKQDADQALETPLPEQKRKEKMADTGAAAGESRKTMSAPSPSQAKASASPQHARKDGVSMRVLWRISEYRLGGSDALWGEEEARRLLFKPLDIAAGKITFDGQTCSNVVFKTEKVNTKEYLDHTFHSTPQALGIERRDGGAGKDRLPLPGFSEYMRLNDRRIVIHLNGVFFFFAPAVDY